MSGLILNYSASFLGAQVSGTIRKGIMDPLEFTGSERELMLGYVSSLASCCIWLIVATVLNLPVSGTHSIVGAIVGMALVSRGFGSIKWWAIAKIGKCNPSSNNVTHGLKLFAFRHS